MPQPKDKDWLNGYKNKTPIYAVYKRPTSVQTESERLEYKYITFHDKGGLKVCQWSLGPNLELWSGDDPGLPRWFNESTRSLKVKKAGKRD